MANHSVYVWRGSIDPDTYHVGVKWSKGFTTWFSVFVDGIGDVFGEDAKAALKNIPFGVLVPIETTMTVVKED